MVLFVTLSSIVLQENTVNKKSVHFVDKKIAVKRQEAFASLQLLFTYTMSYND